MRTEADVCRSAARLILFDVDGTLTDTMAVDTWCFLRAFADVCGFTDVDSDWSRYRNATDPGIFQEVFESRVGRSPSADETTQFRDHLVRLFRLAALEKPFVPIHGAPEILGRLCQSHDYRVGLATGCWADAARVKLASAGLCYDAYPGASADDAQERETIVRLAAQRTAKHGGEEWKRAVYVGDGVWDMRVCRVLGIRFIGIGTGTEEQKLIAAGAAQVLPDFSDIDLFFSLLQTP